MTETSTKKKAVSVTDADIIKLLLKDAPATEEFSLEFPSNNVGYADLNDKAPTLRPMTFDDEKALLANKDPNIDPVNILLNRCLTNITVAELYQMDKLYVLMKLREISYGDEYQFEITCPSCQKPSEVMFKLSELPMKEVEEEFGDPIEVTLPVLGHKLTIKLPRVKDEQYFETTERALSNLWRFVMNINEFTQKAVITKVIEKLPLKDAHAVLNAISGTKYGLDTQVNFLCHYCSTRTKMEMPITSDFFTVS
jgi:hypothetical protein